MARRRKNNSALDLIITGSWKVSAFFAVIIIIVLFIVIPLLNNPYLQALNTSLKPIGMIAIVVLILTSLLKFKLQNKTVNPIEPTLEKKTILIENKTVKAIEPTFEKKLILKENKTLAKSQSRPQEDVAHTRPSEWSLKVIQEIEWKRFEELSTAFYLEKGIRAEATTLGADGGIDIKLYQDETGKPTSLIQCKSWYNKQIGVKEIREFLGVLTHEKIPKGFYMISGTFSEDAKETAKANKINLISGEMFLLMIKRLPEVSQSKLLALATAGDYKTPTCSACGVKMIRRKIINSHIWGCINYPKCRHMMYVKKSEI